MENTKKEEHFALETTQTQQVLHDALKSVLKSAGTALNMQSLEVAAILGAVAGAFTACKDDTIVHDPKAMELIEKGAAECGCAVTTTPCRDILQLNFEHANTNHYESHRKAREAGFGDDIVH